MMKKIVGGLTASIALASPVQAQEVQQPKNNITPRTELVNSYKGLNQAHKEMAIEALSDNLLISEEIYTLNDFLLKNLEHLQGISASQEKVIRTFIPVIDEVLNNYPAFLDNRVNIAYDANTELSKEHSDSLKNLIQEKPNKNLEKVLIKENLTLKDLIEICYAYDLVGGEILSNAQEISNKEEVEKTSSAYTVYVITTTQLKKDKWYNETSRWNLGILGAIKYAGEYRNKIEDSEKRIERNLGGLSGDFKIKDFTKAIPNAPSWWHVFTCLFSMFAPLGLRFGVKSYTGRTKWTEGEVWYHTFDAGVGLLGFEMLLPQIFYVRMAIPLVNEIYKGYTPNRRRKYV
ncbi:hypothetical protein HY837_01605 [archaeon]|nr:hypothetical protein [archaeon]